MGSSAPALVNRKWLLCVQATLVISFVLLISFFLGQSWRPGSSAAAFVYLGGIRNNVAAFNQHAGSGQSHVQLPLQHTAEENPFPPTQLPIVRETVLSPPQLQIVTPPAPPPQIATPPPQLSVIDIDATTRSVSGGGDGAGATAIAAEEGKCDIFDGKWVYDRETYPLYEARRCPILSDQVSCRKNGRPDSGYEHLRWEANSCDIPRFNGTDMLERLRGKRVVIVGDSINKNQWESLACLLYSSAGRKRSYYKLHGAYKIFKALVDINNTNVITTTDVEAYNDRVRDGTSIVALMHTVSHAIVTGSDFSLQDYNCSVEFYSSPFLVPLEGGKSEPKVLKLEQLPESAERWKRADILVFNTGHWWAHQGHLKKWTYLERKGERVEEMEGHTAFETAMKTWADWIDRSVDPTKTMVFFRSVSPQHGRQSNHWCYNQTTPVTDETYKEWFPSAMRSIVERTIAKMKTPVKYLNITKLSEFRQDAHTAIYTTRAGRLLTPEERAQAESYADCSHWCLPGLPDTWNVLIYAFIVRSPSIFL